MIRSLTLSMLAVLLMSVPTIAGAPAGRQYLKMYTNYNRAARWHNANTQWHGSYAHPQWQQPVALIVPPIANMQTSYSWGVGRTRMLPIYHQFTRPYVAPGGGGEVVSPTPAWPSSTTHQGVHYIRGPW